MHEHADVKRIAIDAITEAQEYGGRMAVIEEGGELTAVRIAECNEGPRPLAIVWPDGGIDYLPPNLYVVEREGPLVLSIYGTEGNRLVGGNATVAWERDALDRTANALNAGEIEEADAREYAQTQAQALLKANKDGCYHA